MEIRYRSATDHDMPEACEVFFTSLGDLTTRKGLHPSTFNLENVLPVYRHILATGIFEVAELDGRLAAICHAIVRDDLWFLSGFWTLPTLQQRKIGGPLLRRVREEGRRRGGSTAFTWSSINLTAMATYMKHGMLPGYQILNFSGRPARVPDADPRVTLEPLSIACATGIDRVVRATAREIDHAFWLGGPGQGFEARVGGRTAGYFYVNHGAIGPGAWIDPADGEAIVGSALREAARQADAIRIFSLGMNHTAIRAALGAGLQLMGFSHLLFTEPFGQMDRYLPSGPSLF